MKKKLKKNNNKKYINYIKYNNFFFYKSCILKLYERNKLLKNKNLLLKKSKFKKNIKKFLLINKLTIDSNIKKNNMTDIKDTNIENTNIENTNIENTNIEENNTTNIKDEINEYIIKFCVFLGREQNMKILHSYIELSLKHNIINEYHMFNFSKTIKDHYFIITEYERLNNIYKDRIFLHNSEENLKLIDTKRTKINWSPFYTYISKSNNNDIIIKCDDDILFIDIYSLKNLINDRINDKISFLIHSNCINNGVCSYYQKNLFPKLKKELEIYPTGGILGIIFEKPEIACAIHNQFTTDLLKDIYDINKYIIDDIYINSRISINFIILRGEDMIYVENIKIDDEYQLSGLIPEKLGRPNKIKGDFITSHFSYSFQDKILLKRHDLYSSYEKIKDKYIKLNDSLIKKYNNFKINLLKPHIININEEEIYQIKNWYNDNNYYIKNTETNKYLTIDYEEDEFYLSDIKKTPFEIIYKDKNKNIIELKLGIYYLTRYNIVGKFRNEIVLIKYLKEEKEKEIILEIDNNNTNNDYYFKFLKYNIYISLNKKDNLKLDITNEKRNKWKLEKINEYDKNNEPIIECKRYIKNDKIYYQNIQTNEIYSNYYKGWALENVLW